MGNHEGQNVLSRSSVLEKRYMEMGQEIIVRDGKYFTVGDNGAEFVKTKPNDIIFNHEQTEELLKHGHIRGRGKSYANGTLVETSLSSMNGLRGLDVNSLRALGDMLTQNRTVLESLRPIEMNNKIVNTNTHTFTVGDVNITCSGVTSHEVVKEIGASMNKVFEGLAMNAYQHAMA